VSSPAESFAGDGDNGESDVLRRRRDRWWSTIGGESLVFLFLFFHVRLKIYFVLCNFVKRKINENKSGKRKNEMKKCEWKIVNQFAGV
jgi:hypothetical protein